MRIASLVLHLYLYLGPSLDGSQIGRRSPEGGLGNFFAKSKAVPYLPKLGTALSNGDAGTVCRRQQEFFFA